MRFAGGLRGASIIDSLDTLYIMGLTEEYNDAKEWVQTSLDLNSVRNHFKPSRCAPTATTCPLGFDGLPKPETFQKESKASRVAGGRGTSFSAS